MIFLCLGFSIAALFVALDALTTARRANERSEEAAKAALRASFLAGDR